MAHDRDIDWLLERRPDAEEPSTESTERVRAALIAHGVRHRRARQRAGAITAAGVLATAGAAVVVATGGITGHGHPRGTPTRLVIAPTTATHPDAAHHISQTPLVELASYVRTLPAPSQRGDATLVVRDTFINRRHEVDGAIYGGYDLYTDSGKYYYAPDSLAQLQQTFDAHQVTTGGGDEARVLRVLAAAATDTPRQARAAALRTWPKPLSRATVLRQTSQLPPALRRKVRRLEIAPKHESARAIRIHNDSDLYIIATQALEVGAGRPDVRAGAMNVLDTLSHVSETPDRVDGIHALRVRFPDDGTPETIWLDARTGVPIQEKDGATSATSFVVERVTAAHLPTHVSPTAQLR
jgi:hypothetical protein